MPESASLHAEIIAVRWRADDGGGFAVVAALAADGDEIVLTGPLAHLHEGDTVEVVGTWRDHPRHGRQLVCERIKVGRPSSDTALLAILGSIKHVGPRGAQWLLDRHGTQVLEVVDRDPGARLREVPGIGRAKIRDAVACWQEQSGGRALRLFLEEHGVPAAVAARVHKAMGGRALSLLEEDPYALIRVDGIGFATADAVARALSVAADSPQRIDAALHHALVDAEADGHCFLPRNELAARAGRLLGLPPARVSERIDEAELVLDGDRVLEPRMDRAERRLAERIRELTQLPPSLDINIPQHPPSGPGAPTPAQWAAVRTVAEHRVAVLTGLPGTGKTATMRALVDVLRSAKRAVCLCAPTGKAARRLEEAADTQASTIHRLLEWTPGVGPQRNRDDPLIGIDLLVVDEASMLDVRLAGALLDAVGTRTHVLLVGDVDQLAPVGPGRVLDDLIASEVVPAVRLTEVFRQAARSLIVRAAHAINRGDRPPTRPNPDDREAVRDFFLIEPPTADEVFSEVVSLATERLAAHYGVSATADVQVLAPMHRGPAGIDALNDALRARLNPDGKQVPKTPLRVGDRLMQTRNDHDRAFYNGEVAVVLDYRADHEGLLLGCDDGRRIRMDLADAGTLRLAYAASVHKMQGSQVPIVVVALSRGQAVMLTRSLVYTAVTRAQTACVVVAEQGALDLALGRVDARRRHTRLAQLVR